MLMYEIVRITGQLKVNEVEGLEAQVGFVIENNKTVGIPVIPLKYSKYKTYLTKDDINQVVDNKFVYCTDLTEGLRIWEKYLNSQLVALQVDLNNTKSCLGNLRQLQYLRDTE
ncbi:MAG: hypothetical protein ACRDBY_14175 [Cetobacterium sp.]